MGLLAAGVWAVDRPEAPGNLYYLADPQQEFPLPQSDEPTFTGAGFFDFSPVPDGKLPVSLWLAIPMTTTLFGAGVGLGASAAGVRISRS